jgi:RimJ/RimL family protein N-acetyltransferase
LGRVVTEVYRGWTSRLLGYPIEGGVVFTSVDRVGNPLGSIIVHNYRAGFNAEIGIATTKVGLNKALIRAAMNYLFVQLRLPRVSIIVNATDSAQLAIVLRLGGVAEGVFTDWYGPNIDGIQFRITYQTLGKFQKLLKV